MTPQCYMEFNNSTGYKTKFNSNSALNATFPTSNEFLQPLGVMYSTNCSTTQQDGCFNSTHQPNLWRPTIDHGLNTSVNTSPSIPSPPLPSRKHVDTSAHVDKPINGSTIVTALSSKNLPLFRNITTTPRCNSSTGVQKFLTPRNNPRSEGLQRDTYINMISTPKPIFRRIPSNHQHFMCSPAARSPYHYQCFLAPSTFNQPLHTSNAHSEMPYFQKAIMYNNPSFAPFPIHESLIHAAETILQFACNQPIISNVNQHYIEMNEHSVHDNEEYDVDAS